MCFTYIVVISFAHFIIISALRVFSPSMERLIFLYHWYFRCKAYNTTQLVVYMNEIFENYMRQRLLDVALKRRRAKPIMTTSVRPENVEKVDGTTFTVTSDKGDTQYVVDLQLGLCDCPYGQTGAVCKHQVACSEMHALKLPQVFHSTPTNRQFIASIALGDKDVPPLDFFVELQDDSLVNDNSSSPVPLNTASEAGVADSREPASENSLEDFVVNSPSFSCTTNKKQEVLQLLNEAFERFSDGVSSSAITAMATKLKTLKTANQLNSCMHMFAASSSISCKRSKIHCQPTSVARRKVGTPRGSATVGKGRTRTNTALPTTAKKRPRNLSHNITCNQPNAKSHG